MKKCWLNQQRVKLRWNGVELNEMKWIRRICHWTEKSQPEGKRIMPELRFTVYLALSIVLRVGISRSAL